MIITSQNNEMQSFKAHNLQRFSKEKKEFKAIKLKSFNYISEPKKRGVYCSTPNKSTKKRKKIISASKNSQNLRRNISRTSNSANQNGRQRSMNETW